MRPDKTKTPEFGTEKGLSQGHKGCWLPWPWGSRQLINLSLLQTPAFWYCLASLCVVGHTDLRFGTCASITPPVPRPGWRGRSQSVTRQLTCQPEAGWAGGPWGEGRDLPLTPPSTWRPPLLQQLAQCPSNGRPLTVTHLGAGPTSVPTNGWTCPPTVAHWQLPAWGRGPLRQRPMAEWGPLWQRPMAEQDL